MKYFVETVELWFIITVIIIAMIPTVAAVTYSEQGGNGSVILPDTLEEVQGDEQVEVLTTTQSFTVGDHVRTTATLKVREGPGTTYTDISRRIRSHRWEFCRGSESRWLLLVRREISGWY